MKICSLVPAGTEMLFALGLGDHVIGVTGICSYPPEARSRHIVSRSLIDPTCLSSAEVERRMQAILQSGGAPYVLDTEWLEKEKPDLILTQDTCFICQVEASQVTEATAALRPCPQVLVLSPRTLSDIFDCIEKVGEAAGVSWRAAELANRVRDRVESVARQAGRVAFKPRVLSWEGIDPLVCGGRWLPEMKALAGGIDGLFEPGCGPKRITWDEVREYAPEVLVVALCSSPIHRSLRELSWAARQPGWLELPAVQNAQVYVVRDVFFSTPGPRIATGLELLAQILHPELFRGLIPPRAVMKLSWRGVDARPDELPSCFLPYPPDLARVQPEASSVAG